MLIDPRNACLLVVDIQEKLAPAVHGHETMVKNTRWLLEIARLLNVSTLVSEQYPQGLGSTVENLADFVTDSNRMTKEHFACTVEKDCQDRLDAVSREHFVVVGMETHVCVLQTALGLLSQGREVFVVADAVGSRDPEDKRLGLERMRQCGVQIVSREMVAFEWMQRAGTDVFKTISKEYLR